MYSVFRIKFHANVINTLRAITKRLSGCTECGQNYGNTKKLRNIIYVNYTERTSVGNTERSSVRLRTLLLGLVH
jgi:hypothetical protein